MPRPLGKITPLARFFSLVAKAQRCLKRRNQPRRVSRTVQINIINKTSSTGRRIPCVLYSQDYLCFSWS